jgi:hypothetical protein
MASGSSALASSVVLHAPYSGTLGVVGKYGAVSGCSAGVKNPTPAHWTASTGNVTLSGSAKARSCPPSSFGQTGSSAYISNSLQITIPIPISRNGSHTIQLQWNYTAVVLKAVHFGGKCPSATVNAYGYGYAYCSAGASAYFTAYSYVQDYTNSTSFGASNSWSGVSNGFSVYSNEQCSYGGTCTWTNSTSNNYAGLGTHSFRWWVNGTFSAGDHVVLFLNVYGSASTNAYGYPSTTSTASFNVATSGNGARLAWVSVS